MALSIMPKTQPMLKIKVNLDCLCSCSDVTGIFALAGKERKGFGTEGVAPNDRTFPATSSND
jgi:hypothetical protein